jgi:hypothetical protein
MGHLVQRGHAKSFIPILMLVDALRPGEVESPASLSILGSDQLRVWCTDGSRLQFPQL